jgi:hypothetical protein
MYSEMGHNAASVLLELNENGNMVAKSNKTRKETNEERVKIEFGNPGDDGIIMFIIFVQFCTTILHSVETILQEIFSVANL